MSAANEGKQWPPWSSGGPLLWELGVEWGERETLPAPFSLGLSFGLCARREEGGGRREKRDMHTLSHAYTYISVHMSPMDTWSMPHMSCHRYLTGVSQLFDFGVQVSYPVGGFGHAGGVLFLPSALPHPHFFFS